MVKIINFMKLNTQIYFMSTLIKKLIGMKKYFYLRIFSTGNMVVNVIKNFTLAILVVLVTLELGYVIYFIVKKINHLVKIIYLSESN